MIDPRYDCKTMKWEREQMIKLLEYRKKFKSDYALAKALGKPQTNVSNWLKAGAYINIEECKIYIPSSDVKVQSL